MGRTLEALKQSTTRRDPLPRVTRPTKDAPALQAVWPEDGVQEADVPFVEKWRTAMGYLDEDMASGYQKVWLELQALAWNNADIAGRLARVNGEWRAVLTEAFDEPRRQLGIELPPEALVSLVMTFNLGIIVERLGGIETGHRELLDWIDRWISR